MELVGRRYGAMKAAGIMLAEMALSAGVSRSSITRTLGGERHGYHIKAVTAWRLNKSYKWLWGEKLLRPTAEEAERLAREAQIAWCPKEEKEHPEMPFVDMVFSDCAECEETGCRVSGSGFREKTEKDLSTKGTKKNQEV